MQAIFSRQGGIVLELASKPSCSLAWLAAEVFLSMVFHGVACRSSCIMDKWNELAWKCHEMLARLFQYDVTGGLPQVPSHL